MLKRFCQKAVGTRFNSPKAVRVFIEDGQHEAGEIAKLLHGAQAFANLKSVKAGEHDV